MKALNVIKFIPSSINEQKADKFFSNLKTIRKIGIPGHTAYSGDYTVADYHLPKGIIARCYENDNYGIPYSMAFYKY